MHISSARTKTTESLRPDLLDFVIQSVVSDKGNICFTFLQQILKTLHETEKSRKIEGQLKL